MTKPIDDTHPGDVDGTNNGAQGSSVKKQETTSSGASHSIVLYVLLLIIAACAIVIVGELGALVSFASKDQAVVSTLSESELNDASASSGHEVSTTSTSTDHTSDHGTEEVDENNICLNQNPNVENVACIVDAIANVGPQAGANVTRGYNGSMPVDVFPIMTPFDNTEMCPVNVHWHLGTEHLSVGEFDESGSGPAFPEDEITGYQCKLYDASDAKFTTPYNWQNCKDMEVGQTYEVHWPHSAAGACGTEYQYQTPFAQGVFCIDGILTDDIAHQIGVQAQVFVVVNDESYYIPNLFDGMIVSGEMGQDIAMYTGSTTGDKVNNEICSPYSPITWHVDRKCHLISASSFDEMCGEMKMQAADMSGDLHPHGSRPLVADELAAANHNNRGRHSLRA